VALDGTWDTAYGWDASAKQVFVGEGGNRAFTTSEAGSVTFWYDPATHYFADSAAGLYTVTGTLLDCNWNAACQAAWLQEIPDANGTVYRWETGSLAAGTYQFKVIRNGSEWLTNTCGAGTTAVGTNCQFTVAAGQAVQLYFNDSTDYVSVVTSAPPATQIDAVRAYWIDRTTIAFPASLLPSGISADAVDWQLVTAPDGGLSLTGSQISATGAASYPLTLVAAGLTSAQKDKFRTLADGYVRLAVPPEAVGNIEAILQGETLVAAYAHGGILQAVTGTQNAGVLDAVWGTAAAAAAAADQPLGVTWVDGVPTFRIWAPTARDVELCVWLPSGAGECVPQLAEREDVTGIWTVTGDAGWKDLEYVWHVQVYALQFAYTWPDNVETASATPAYDGVYDNTVVDAYATGLTVDSERAVAVDPADWAPATAALEPIAAVDQTIYELHVRDFSINDASVPETLRGTFAAFAEADSDGHSQLEKLAEAGITTVHLLPTYDIATIPEDRADQDNSVTAVTGSSTAARDSLNVAEDGFNWGYDPLHWMAPEGSYASAGHQVGAARNAEFAQMVDALHAVGIRVVLDQVYNHTYSSGQQWDNVLDQAVPGYYHRLDAMGEVSRSTCCDEFASETAMGEQMMIDAIVTWARDYHVDGFRFDLMGFASVATMEKIQAALADLAEDQGRVGALKRDGSGERDDVFYLYGEGWNFGSIADNRLFFAAIQGQLNGTGIGTFSDILRDAVIGSHSPLDATGFATGSATACTDDDIRQGLAGNLYSYSFIGSCGSHSVGYASEPGESVSYVDAHDNQTLYDLLAMRLWDGTPMDKRIRINTLALATVTLGQSPSFWHAGTDLLRSKSLDPNSYNSGDYFNLIDWTGATNAFGTGLPPTTERDGYDWTTEMSALLNNSALKPTQADALAAQAQALDLLRLRASTPLFRLGTADLISERVVFPRSGGSDAEPGFITMVVEDPGPTSDRASADGVDIDPDLDSILVVFNSNWDEHTQTLPAYTGRDYVLSDVLTDEGSDPVLEDAGWDPATGAVTLPGLSVAVFVEKAAAEPEPEPVTLTLSRPLLSGEATPGSTLTLDVTATPADATVTYQWFKGLSLIPGASGTSYTLTNAEGGKDITVKVTASRPGSEPVVKYSNHLIVSEVVTVTRAQLTGTATVGSTLTAEVDYGPAGATATYLWMRGTSAISGASGPTYTLTSADSGKDLVVRVTVAAPGLDSVVKYTNHMIVSGPVAPSITKATLSGGTGVGDTLTLDLQVSAGATVTVYWFKGTSLAQPAGDQTLLTYTLKAADLGKDFSVKVVASAEGFPSVTKYSNHIVIPAG
jgi:pullulanase/glycogen debranching enzyme